MINEALIKYKEKILYSKDLLLSLEEIGLSKGDMLCVHTEIFSFGMPLLKKEDFLNKIIEIFKDILGKNGTLIMPTFTYSFCKNLDFDKLNSRSTMGILTEHYRKQNGVYRTNDPIFSFAISGAKAELLKKDCKSCFEKGSVYDVLKDEKGKLLIFGNQKLGYTFTHFIEEEALVSYRYFKEFNGNFIDEMGNKRQKSIKYYVRKLNEKSELDIDKVLKLLKQSNNFNTKNVANANITLIDTKKYYDTFYEMMKRDENFLLKE
ncbi:MULTISPECIES: AAC(3) family N-acetyltransferase [unclassified Campylobacter]|uniref:AAC(3) family N-acetyltransferase n=1 Tax=unclassified Campylobacter TaxID=2593542 RepID=UPI001CC21BF9|nr:MULTISPECIES: AAC(3) family N-acetyltransferase [unclassified Campylobacter]